MILSQKIKEYRAQKGWTQEDLAKFSGVSLPSIKRYETGNDNITTTNLKKIAVALDADIINFMSPNLSPNIKKNVSQSVSQSQNLSSSLSSKMSSSKKNLSSSQEDNLSLNVPKLSLSKNKEQDSAEIVKIPYFEDTYASAGSGAINYDEVPIIMELDINFIRVFLQITTSVKNMHIINAKGDSMEPTIKDGELLYINPIDNEGGINSGSIYVINFDGDTLVKRIDKNPITKALTLISDNSKYKPIDIEKENLELCHIVGRVVAHTAKL